MEEGTATMNSTLTNKTVDWNEIDRILNE